MSFELNNYHRNISAEDLLTDVQNLSLIHISEPTRRS